MQAMHTYTLIKAKFFYGSEKIKQREYRQFQIIISKELLPCVTF